MNNQTTETERPSQLVVYKASAGSGKTFRLAVEYIKLLVQDPEAYRHILAVTFTTKATGEMKERIMGQLYGIAEEDKDSLPYQEVICSELHLSPEELRRRAKEVLIRILHDYSYFRITTIDSFFVSIVRNMARELRLGANMEISLDVDEIVTQAVEELIDGLEAQSPLMMAIMDFVDDRLNENHHWDPRSDIKQFAQTMLFNEEYVTRGEALRKIQEQDGDFLTRYRRKLLREKNALTKELTDCADLFFAALAAHSLEVSDLANGKLGVASYFSKIRNKKFDDGFGKNVEKVKDDPKKWASGNTKRSNEEVTLAESQLLPLLHKTEALRCRLNSIALALKNLNTLRLLNEIDTIVRRVNERNDRVMLASTNSLLSKMTQNDTSFVYEKIGISLRNIMIDEFQDTSLMQWHNFKHLLVEGLAGGNDSLIVGDVKQSIYRWRNSDWTILNELRERFERFHIDQRSLTENRRSENNVIRFNNAFFLRAVSFLNDAFRKKYGSDCVPLLTAYDATTLEQQTVKREDRGYVCVSRISAPGKKKDQTDDNSLSYADLTLVQLVETVIELVDKRGVELRDITILVREKHSAQMIADFFSKLLPDIPIISSDSFKLESSPAVQFVISALRYLDNPDDPVLLTQMAIDHQRLVSADAVDWDALIARGAAALPQPFVSAMEELATLPLYELVEQIYRLCNLTAIANQEAYVFRFLDEVQNFLLKESSSTTAFLRFWDENLHSKTIAVSAVDGIKVMTIHASKGLEFHTVLLPFCDIPFIDTQHKTPVWCVPTEPPFDEVPLLPINFSMSMVKSIFAAEYREEELKQWVDNLNLLYVAFTRAASNLFIWTRQREEKSTANAPDAATLIDDVMHEAFHSDDPTFETGAIVPSKKDDEEEKKKKEEQKQKNRFTVKPTEVTDISMVTPDTLIVFRQSNQSKDFIDGREMDSQQEQYIKEGELLHRIFSEIQSRDDVETVLRGMLMEGVVETQQRLRKIRQLVDSALRNPMAAAWFSGEARVYNECNILRINEEDGLPKEERPDRVMLFGDEVVVVDYKFGNPKPKHEEQVNRYMSLLSRMGYSNIRGYLWYVYQNRIIEVKGGNA